MSCQNRMRIEVADLNASLGASILVILWWVSIWFMIEEAILFVSGNRRNVKILICLFISVSVVITCSFFPQNLSRL